MAHRQAWRVLAANASHCSEFCAGARPAAVARTSAAQLDVQGRTQATMGGTRSMSTFRHFASEAATLSHKLHVVAPADLQSPALALKGFPTATFVNAAFPLGELLIAFGAAGGIVAAGAAISASSDTARPGPQQASASSQSRGKGGDAAAAAPQQTSNAPAEPATSPPSARGFPIIRRAEVEQHTAKADRVWVTFGEGVYDITDFIEAHPGGPSKIVLAAGGPLEPYWAMYAQHKQDQVYEILEEMRIGTLPEGERAVATSDPYATDPPRHESIITRSEAPFNGETPPEWLLAHVTPSEYHYVRNHLPVPDVITDAFELQVTAPNGSHQNLTLDDLKRYPKETVTATLQCAGNRRKEMSDARTVNGLPWESAVSTAQWSGVRLSTLLKEMQVEASQDAKHVQFVGLDAGPEGSNYGASVPIQKALSPEGDLLLAYEMNGKEIPRDHGYPLRAVIPGHVAARSVKWLQKVIVSDEESDSHWQQHDYKGFCPDEDWDHLDWSKAPAIQETPITSAIVSPRADTPLPKGAKSATIEGYAVAGGGREVIRVDVSGDGGKTWQPATLSEQGAEQGYRKHWAWRHFMADVPVHQVQDGKVTFVCKAVDDSYNVQPDTFKPIYNARGVLANAWNRMEVPLSTS